MVRLQRLALFGKRKGQNSDLCQSTMQTLITRADEELHPPVTKMQQLDEKAEKSVFLFT